MSKVLIDRELLNTFFSVWDVGLDPDNEIELLRKALAQPDHITTDNTETLYAALAEIERLKACAVPDGFVLVPVTPTIEMIAAIGFGGDVDIAVGHAAVCADVERTYKAMLASRPTE
jgi:hypothetical protein